jgi:galactokinase
VGTLEALGETLDEAQALLRHQMSVSTPLIDSCAARLRASGGLGVKITGTGHGGCLFALTTTGADTDRLIRSLDDLQVSARLVAPTAIGPHLM